MPEAATPLPTVAGPGVYDIPADAYHRDPVPGGSLSSTGARKLLPPSCPALFRHWLDHGEAPRADYDFGHAAHTRVLGSGPEVELLDYDNWRTNEVKAKAEAARAAGKVPMLTKEYAPIAGMVTALAAHPVASAVLAPGRGRTEQTLVWTDADTGVPCRAMLDHLPYPVAGRRLIVADYKTCLSAAPDDLGRVISKLGYHVQATHYLDGVQALGLAPAGAAFVFVFQEKTPPYLVTVVELTGVALDIGRHLNREARRTYRRCMETGRWPGYSDGIEIVSLPAWVERAYMEDNQ
jgi:hypothetical protein